MKTRSKPDKRPLIARRKRRKKVFIGGRNSQCDVWSLFSGLRTPTSRFSTTAARPRRDAVVKPFPIRDFVMPLSPLAGKPAPKNLLIDPDQLRREYLSRQ